MKNKYLLLISCFVFLVLLVVSPDSYLHDVYAHFDTTVFQFYGKAMMEGQVPYVDFNEAKGPLLFLIYGIGYLISSYNFIGVFWLSVLAYIFIYYYTYRIALLITNDEKHAFLSTILMTVFYFNPLVQYEVKAESFAQVFILPSLYYTLRLIEPERKVNIKLVAFVLGFCFAACCLIKLNIGAMIGVFILWGLYYTSRCRKICNYLIFGFVGVVCCALPFLVYFIANNAFPECVTNFLYAMNFTIGNYSQESSYVVKLLRFFIEPVALCVFISILCGIFLFSKRCKKYGLFPLVSFLLFFFVVLQAGAFHYYYIVCNAFYVFGVCALIYYCKRSKMVRYALPCFVFFSVAVVNLARCWLGSKTEDLFFQNSDKRQKYYKYAYVMSQVKNPSFVSVAYLQSWDVASGAVPGCKYPLHINGEPQSVTNDRLDAIKKGVDFVCVDKDSINLISKMEKWGYNRYNFGGPYLYSRKNLKLPPSDFHVSPMDILFKRDVLKDVRKQ